ncbi:hypothetical protein CALVIDRAFT_96509 [Calocera viscosa TUFC12733]|uniref:Uncharacterized protein n=1 Tax=Calocera viscosa (strain TUFC12733) TaxID=1330018 RepID=A0A167MYV7_CALVF|nr:hypothetical protein CALVIDRAFT_96509 [Calocera viscosa TUFC12733]
MNETFGATFFAIRFWHRAGASIGAESSRIWCSNRARGDFGVGRETRQRRNLAQIGTAHVRRTGFDFGSAGCCLVYEPIVHGGHGLDTALRIRFAGIDLMVDSMYSKKHALENAQDMCPQETRSWRTQGSNKSGDPSAPARPKAVEACTQTKLWWGNKPRYITPHGGGTAGACSSPATTLVELPQPRPCSVVYLHPS